MSEIISRTYTLTTKGVRYTVEMQVDLNALAHDLVNKAVSNRTGKATEVGRRIIAKVIDRVATHEAEALGDEVLTHCAAARDGECNHAQCPQLRDGALAFGRHCPLDNLDEG